jgi:hypothetical protein
LSNEWDVKINRVTMPETLVLRSCTGLDNDNYNNVETVSMTLSL